jgi:hypothetical protein
MRTKKDLEKRIEELESLVEQQKNLIDILLTQRNNNTTLIPNNTEDLCIDGKGHDYPSPWHSVTAPNCRKCGKIGEMMFPTFMTSNDTNFLG